MTNKEKALSKTGSLLNNDTILNGILIMDIETAVNASILRIVFNPLCEVKDQAKIERGRTDNVIRAAMNEILVKTARLFLFII